MLSVAHDRPFDENVKRKESIEQGSLAIETDGLRLRSLREHR